MADRPDLARATTAAGAALDPARSAGVPPSIDTLYADVGMRLFGRPMVDQLDPAALELRAAYMQVLPSNPLAVRTAATPLVPFLGETQAPIDLDPWRAARFGFGESFLGGVGNWLAAHAAMRWENDPNYDPYANVKIAQSKWAGQWHLFEHNRSEAETDWILRRLEEHEREAAVIDRMNPVGAAVRFAGGMLGDPQAMLPLGMGVKTTLLANKAIAGTLGPAEAAAFGHRPFLYGSMTDALRAAGAQAGTHIAMDAMHQGLDPTAPVELAAAAIAIPSALAASAAFARAGMRRLSEGMDALRQRWNPSARLTEPVFQPGTPEELTAALRGNTMLTAPPHAGPPGPQRGTIDPILQPGALATNYPHMRAAEAVMHGLDPDGSLSAALAPGSAILDRAELLRRGRMVPTGIGLEHTDIDMVTRAAKSPFVVLQDAIEGLLGGGSRLRNKNLEGIASDLPVETAFAVRWNLPATEAMRATQDAWRAYREELSGIVQPGMARRSDMERLVFEARTGMADMFARGDRGLSYEAFRRRVGDATRNGDRDLVLDAATPQVEKAAKAHRRLWDDLRDESEGVGLFREHYERQLERAQGRVAALRADRKTSGEAMRGAEGELRAVEERLEQLRRDGPSVNTAPSYRPRLWLQGELAASEAEFRDIVTRFYMAKGMQRAEAGEIAGSVFETLSRQKPVFGSHEVETAFKEAVNTTGAMARTFEIPDHLVARFLENDIEVLSRWHGRQMGMSVELARRFGSTGLDDVARELQAEAKGLIDKAATSEEKATLRRQLKGGLEDLQAARDRLLGTYGAAAEPHTWDNRLIRIAKQFSNITLLGLSGFTALGDLVRPAMTEGLQAMHHYGFRTLASEARSTIMQLSRRELEIAGDAMELQNNLRSLSASDTGDLMHGRTRLERWLHQANQYFFVANGLNAINQLDKEWSGLIIQGRINDVFLSFRRTGRLDPADASRLAANGIDEEMARRIAAELHANQIRFNTLTLANTTAWEDRLAARHYSAALFQMNNRTVPTPGIGDTPNIFSTPLGSLIFQYKSFAAGALTRTLYSGLQEGGAKFWYGAAMAVGFAVVLNEIRSRLFYDRSTFDQPLTAVVADGVERSGVLGWFTDVNRAIETLTGHRFGARPLIGAEQPHKDDVARQAGLLFGPSIGQGARALDVAGSFMSGHPVARTWADARMLAPGATLPFLDPAYDRLISDGRWHPAKDPSGRKRGAKTDTLAEP